MRPKQTRLILPTATGGSIKEKFYQDLNFNWFLNFQNAKSFSNCLSIPPMLLTMYDCIWLNYAEPFSEAEETNFDAILVRLFQKLPAF